jgi:hypothetical protein
MKGHSRYPIGWRWFLFCCDKQCTVVWSGASFSGGGDRRLTRSFPSEDFLDGARLTGYHGERGMKGHDRYPIGRKLLSSLPTASSHDGFQHGGTSGITHFSFSKNFLRGAELTSPNLLQWHIPSHPKHETINRGFGVSITIQTPTASPTAAHRKQRTKIQTNTSKNRASIILLYSTVHIYWPNNYKSDIHPLCRRTKERK